MKLLVERRDRSVAHASWATHIISRAQMTCPFSCLQANDSFAEGVVCNDCVLKHKWYVESREYDRCGHADHARSDRDKHTNQESSLHFSAQRMRHRRANSAYGARACWGQISSSPMCFAIKSKSESWWTSCKPFSAQKVPMRTSIVFLTVTPLDLRSR